mmetsp:Transcript_16949/g.38899  ORF Transcript_16949/g.38899 Transcript_16949/m.38899 type:complete len:436 (+) Transcript_16949:804-2111(+)
MVDLLRNVEVVLGENLRDSAEHTGLVFVHDRDSNVIGVSLRERGIGKVDGVTNGTVFEVQPEGLGGHGGGTVLGFSRRCSQVGNDNGVGVIPQEVVGEIRNVLGPLALVEELLHCLGIDQFATRKVEDYGVGLAVTKDGLSNDAVRTLCVWNVQTNVIRVCDRRCDAVGQLEVPGKLHGRLDRQTGIVSHQIHSQCVRIRGGGRSDVPESHHGQRFPLDFSATKHGLVLFDAFPLLALFSELRHVIDAVDDASASQQESTEHEFLHRVGIRSGGVEDWDSELCHASDGDVVGTGTASSNRSDRWLNFFLLELVGSKHESVRRSTIGGVVGQDIVQILGEDGESDLGNLVEGLCAVFVGVLEFVDLVGVPSRNKVIDLVRGSGVESRSNAKRRRRRSGGEKRREGSAGVGPGSNRKGGHLELLCVVVSFQLLVIYK